MKIDPFDEEDWNEIELDNTFSSWLNLKYPDKSKWNEIIHIDCTYNKLTSLNDIENLSQLNILYYSNNELTSLSGIENLTNLKELDCSNNKIKRIKGIDKLPNLKYLDCDNNQLSMMEKLTHLK